MRLTRCFSTSRKCLHGHEDGVSLANKMSEADGDFAAAFLAYQRARYLRTGRVQRWPAYTARSITLPMWSVSFEMRCWSIALRNRRTNQWRGYTTTRERSDRYVLLPDRVPLADKDAARFAAYSSRSAGPSFFTLFASGEAGCITSSSEGAGTSSRFSESGSSSRGFIQSSAARSSRITGIRS